jgi:DNA-binding MarR family transcriptional regulator
MNQDKLRTFRLLEAIDSGELLTQRGLARDLNISLGLVNTCLKRLANKGYFEVTTIPKNRVRYCLTSKGVQEKSRLTYEYIQYSMGFYREMREILLALFTRLQREGVERLALYGCDEGAELAHLLLQNTSIELAGIFADKADGKKFYGHEVKDCQALTNANFNYVLLTHTQNIEHHYHYLLSAGVKPECILDLCDPTKSTDNQR